MSKKEFIATTCASEVVYYKYYGKNIKESRSISIYVEYIWSRPNKVCILSNDFGESCMEYYGHWDVESCIHIQDKAVQKLANKFSARDANTLLRRMADRFRPYGWDSYYEIEAWLKQKGIEYSTSIY